MQIPTDALEDHTANNLSLRFRNSGYAFILAHELGHLYHAHVSSSITNEEEADLFALNIMQRTSTIPMEITLWLQATAYYSWNRGDFASEQAWKRFLERNPPTHPLNGQRLRVLAQRLKDHADDFTQIVQKAADKEIILFIANGILDRIVPVLEDVFLVEAKNRPGF